ncbi:MAG: esterase-like activity of phytase family protein [Rhodobacter sp.]|jgi:hypothetical protein|nr:esterase-like activity of phytase family protein [Rhodobacter sp.]
MRRRSFLALIAALCLATGSANPSGQSDTAGFIGSYLWFNDDERFGGVSALELSEDGSLLTALTDRGVLIHAAIQRDAEGKIAEITAEPLIALGMPATDQITASTYDTEGLALAPDGSFFVSTELDTRVLRFDPSGQTPVTLPAPREFGAMAGNAGLEALAIGADGALYTMPEVTNRQDGAYPVFRYSNGRWDRPFLIRGTEGFLPVGADFGPDGRLYVLERQFRGLGGFASRVRRIAPSGPGIAADEVLIETAPGAFANLEGLSVWRDAGGALRLTLVADDNFLVFLATEVVEFTVPD